MTTQNTFPVIRALALQVAAITDEQVRELQDYFARRHSIGPILDPTGYRNDMVMAEKCENLFDAFVAFRTIVLAAIAEERATLAKVTETAK